ncbi:MAG: thermonuclease family protein [Nitrospira sp.]
MSFGQTVTVQRTGKDRYGRTLARVILRDGKNLNHELVKEGCWWYRKYAPDYATLQALEAEAHLAKKGLWADANPVPPWVWRKKGQQVNSLPLR